MKFPIKKAIPRHAPDLEMADYWIYLKSILFKSRSNISLEKIWRPFLGSRVYVPTPTGRHALWYFLELINLPEGSEVLVSAYNYYVIIRLLIQQKLVPVFVDIELDTLCMDPEDLKKKITGRSRLVVVTHMFGNPADLEGIKKICTTEKLYLFEDCAHAVGSYDKNGNHVGKSDGALFSFGVYKLINTFGGGMLVVSKKLISDYKFKFENEHLSGVHSFLDNFVRFIISIFFNPWLYSFSLFPSLGFIKKYSPKIYKMIDPSKDDPSYLFRSYNRAPFKKFMAEMMRRQIFRVGNNISKRKRIVEKIKNGISVISKIRFLKEDKNGKSNYSYFGVYVPSPKDLSEFLRKRHITTNPKEYNDCSSLEQFSLYGSINKNSSYASTHLIRLPSYPGLNSKDIGYIVDSINFYFSDRKKIN